ncbi:hypothetical protein CR513_28241, partial [Mucuna pruriens]
MLNLGALINIMPTSIYKSLNYGDLEPTGMTIQLPNRSVEFQVDQKVLLFNSRLKLIAGKLCSRWDGPFIITKVFPYGAVELQDELIRSTFQANRQQLKIFHEGPTTTVGGMESISLTEPATTADTT